MFIDKPDPGIGYILFNGLVILFLLLIPFFLKNIKHLRLTLFIPVCVICVCGAIIFALFLHAGFYTEYIIDDQNISIKNGLIQKTTVALKSIERVENEPLIWQPIGFTLKWKGYSNRWINGISLRTAKRVIFLSPKNINRFLDEIRQRREYKPSV